MLVTFLFQETEEKQLKKAFKRQQLIQCPLSCVRIVPVATRKATWDCSSAKEQDAFVTFIAQTAISPHR